MIRTMTTTDAAAIASACFAAWQARDFDTFRSLLADDCVQGIKGMSDMITDIVVHTMLADDSDAITRFDPHANGGLILPTANWSHVENGKITRIRAAFDPRPPTEQRKS